MDKENDEGFAPEARKIEEIEEAARKALEMDREWYSKPCHFRHIPSVPEDVCANCVYLTDISDEVGIRAFGCVRKHGPIFLDLDMTTEQYLYDMANYQCGKFEWKEDEEDGPPG